MKVNLSKLSQYLFLILAALFMIFPILWILSCSLKTEIGIFAYPPKIIPDEFDFKNYLRVFTETNIVIYFRNTILVSALNAVGTVISSSLVAYALARLNFKGKNIVFALILGTMMVPVYATIIPQFIMFKQFKWLNSLLPLIIPAFTAYPYNVFLFRQFFLTIPKALDESAYIDGCTRFRIFYNIILPLSKPVILTVGIMSFIFWWNELFIPMIYIDSDNLKTLTLGVLTAYRSPGSKTEWNMIMTAATIMVIPCIVIFLLFQKYFVEGIKTSGIKG